MPEIEDVTRPAAGLGHDLANTFSQQVFPGKQRNGVEIALNGRSMAKGGPALIEWNAPV